ncbi:probable carboxylesterase 2 [Cucurbita pepo subsp. pepo]|uniref:probable carboxylesterase 2 n=1 Tax=Cucurbita pepo subsp. pepo TaxID=3664 RepID=UPI000C9D69DB|nr:probable carboxylesterase 2 [Cucurbita pepo subsp. pepo]
MVAPDSNNPELELELELLPYLRVYKNGVVERLVGTRVTPPGLDSLTGVDSKDITIVPETGITARLYRPTAVEPPRKLPLVVYFHGGAFLITSSAEPIYHNNCLIPLAAATESVVLSVNYRLAPEHPLPAAYEDSWAALQWVAEQSKTSGDEAGQEPWLKQLVDFEKVFLLGDSAGGNIAHHMALRAQNSNLAGKFKIRGIALIQPYFWGEEPIGSEITEPEKKALVDSWWNFVCPSDRGNDDLLINPFADGSPSVEGLVGEKVVVIVAEKDILRDRGMIYYENLAKSNWKGKVDIFETEGEDHAFHLLDPTSEKAKRLVNRLALFVNED